MPSQKKSKIVFAILLFLIIAIPVSIVSLQQQQETRSKATAATTLLLTPPTANVTTGGTISLDVMVNPGTNLVTFVKVKLAYDPTVFELGPTPFVRNQNAFPVNVEGPAVSPGSFTQSVSIGSDATKAISTLTKVGTITFKAIKSTNNTPSPITFPNGTIVLSLAQGDHPNENVLSTTVPAAITVGGDSLTPIPTVTNSPSTPTITQAISPSPTAVITQLPSPTSLTPTAIPSPTPGVRLTLNVFLHNIGKSGDNANPNSSLSNKTPKRPNRAVKVLLYNATNELVATLPGDVTYNSTTGDYVGVASAQSVPSGNYIVGVKTDQHLTRKVPGIISYVAGQSITLNPVSLVAGDANNDNKLNILDYNVLLDCYSDTLPAPACNDDNKKITTDFNDEGLVNYIDYNLFLRELSTQHGD